MFSINKKEEYIRSNSVLMGDSLTFVISVKANRLVNNIKTSVVIMNANEVKVVALRSHEMTDVVYQSEGDFVIQVRADNLNLMPGNYFITIAMAENNQTISIKEECLSFNIVENDVFGTGKIPSGEYLIYSNATWELRKK